MVGHQVIGNLSEPLEITMMHLNNYADYLTQAVPRSESRDVRAMLTTGFTRAMALHERYVEVYQPYQVMLNVNRTSIYSKTYVTPDNDHIEQIYLGQEELKIRRVGYNAMAKQDAIHIGYEADVTERSY